MENPYQSPLTVDPAGFAPATEAETVRRAYVGHEAMVKSIGTLMILGGIVNVASSTGGARSRVISIVLGCINLGLGLAVRRLVPSVRIPMIVLISIGLLFSLGLMLKAPLVAALVALFYTWILWAVASAKGRTVFSPEYKAIIAQTPHVKYRTSKVAWIALAIVVALGVVGFLIAVGRA